MKTRILKNITTMKDLIENLQKNFESDDLIPLVVIQVAPIGSVIKEDGYIGCAHLASVHNTNKDLIETRKSLYTVKEVRNYALKITRDFVEAELTEQFEQRPDPTIVTRVIKGLTAMGVTYLNTLANKYKTDVIRVCGSGKTSKCIFKMAEKYGIEFDSYGHH